MIPRANEYDESFQWKIFLGANFEDENDTRDERGEKNVRPRERNFRPRESNFRPREKSVRIASIGM